MDFIGTICIISLKYKNIKDKNMVKNKFATSLMFSKDLTWLLQIVDWRFYIIDYNFEFKN